MRNLVLLFILLAGGISGYFIGAHRGEAAIEALDAAKQAAQQEKADSDRAITDLKEKMAGLSSVHKDELNKIENNYRRQLGQLNAVLAGKDNRLKELTAKLASNQQEAARLQNSMNGSTDPAEKQKLLARINQLVHEKQNLESSVEGLQCLSAIAPEEIIHQLQGGQP